MVKVIAPFKQMLSWLFMVLISWTFNIEYALNLYKMIIIYRPFNCLNKLLGRDEKQ